ncbi:transcriptional regulator [Actinocatenispora sera]|jgi:DNA-binding HxlR family transcriptional regulator|uniref:Transcriptional regulator n=2 Tax=Actinocatenispora sera TaxID=390989 RepID=A0A810KXD4_9ACTN|nr:transcriptional regulator [Actinocatenispora sera]
MMAALDLFGRRWVLRIIWELRNGPLGFRALQKNCDGMSSSVLDQRLRELNDARIVEQSEDGLYLLTKLGDDVYRSLKPLIAWSHRWARELSDSPGE